MFGLFLTSTNYQLSIRRVNAHKKTGIHVYLLMGGVVRPARELQKSCTNHTSRCLLLNLMPESDSMQNSTSELCWY